MGLGLAAISEKTTHKKGEKASVEKRQIAAREKEGGRDHLSRLGIAELRMGGRGRGMRDCACQRAVRLGETQKKKKRQKDGRRRRLLGSSGGKGRPGPGDYPAPVLYREKKTSSPLSKNFALGRSNAPIWEKKKDLRKSPRSGRELPKGDTAEGEERDQKVV